jgi:hypothetical protein
MAVAMVETGDGPGHAPARHTYEHQGFRIFPVARHFKLLEHRAPLARCECAHPCSNRASQIRATVSAMIGRSSSRIAASSSSAIRA